MEISDDKAELFIELSEKYRDRLSVYIGRLTSDHERARDILQETLLTAFLNFPALKEPDAFTAWTRKIAYRIYLGSLDEVSAEKDMLFEENRFEMDIFSPEILLEKEETQEKVYRTLSKLKRQERKIFLLYFLFGFSHREIAERFAISEAASKKRLERGRKKFCEIWGDTMYKKRGRPANDTLHNINLQASFDRASWMGELSLIEAMLMDGLDINEQDSYGRTLLHYAVHSGNGEAVELLIKNGARSDFKDKAG
jgi:RNA polymerase sigma factor (sigma-70 family)